VRGEDAELKQVDESRFKNWTAPHVKSISTALWDARENGQSSYQLAHPMGFLSIHNALSFAYNYCTWPNIHIVDDLR
jgi:hypothetical protein